MWVGAVEDVDDHGDHDASQDVSFGSKTGFSTSDTGSIDRWSVYDVNVADLDHNGYNDIVDGVYDDGDHTTPSYGVWGSAKGWSSSSVTTLDTSGSGSSWVVGDGASGGAGALRSRLRVPSLQRARSTSRRIASVAGRLGGPAPQTTTREGSWRKRSRRVSAGRSRRSSG